MYKCPGCGGQLFFDPASQQMTCRQCRTEIDPESERLNHILEAGEHDNIGNVPAPDGSYQAHVYTCPNCGGTIMSTEETMVTFCNYCGASVTLEGRIENYERPQRIIPFRVTKEEAEKAYKRTLRRALFAPSYFRKDTTVEKFRGIYMPYWVYAFEQHGMTNASGERSHRRGDYIITDHYRVSSVVDASVDGITYDADSRFSDHLSAGIAPFREVDGKDFKESYMAGFYADLDDIVSDVYELDGSEVAQEYIAGQMMRNPAYAHHGVTGGDVKKSLDVENTSVRKAMCPVWFLSNRTKSDNRISYAVVNGQTGKLMADIPIAFWKYFLASVLLAIPLFLLLNTGFIFTPQELSVIVMGLDIVSFLLLLMQIRKTRQREYELDDKGYMEKLQDGGRRKPPKKMFLWLLLPVLSFLITFLTYQDRPVSDAPYYISAIISLLILAIMVFVLLRLYNRQTTRPIPQFNKRGGDR